MRVALLLCAAFALDAAAAGPVEKMTDVQQPALVEKEEIVPVVEEDGGMERTVICPNNWELFESRCFKFFPTPSTWIDAEKYCLRFDANLASIHSLEEYDYIQKLVKSSGGYAKSWVGATDAVEESQWFWSDGSKFDYHFWGGDEPNNLGGNEHCVEMNDSEDLSWNDLPCDTKLPFVCGTRPLKSL
ncbi:ladderlectin isoform X1 [Larimichthys crocea]|uniref:ladderlectin isoform X1 n=1 Tax=Larimichthys crocea TaxID=215358 RepID=UPI0009017A27|nr:ladderlectin isoform X1 [Larimichthys crocea]